jgi:hypothetical protein
MVLERNINRVNRNNNRVNRNNNRNIVRVGGVVVGVVNNGVRSTPPRLVTVNRYNRDEPIVQSDLVNLVRRLF